MKAPQLTLVESSNIAGFNFVPYESADEGVLIVKFNNGTYYRYAGVPSQVATDLFEAESVGRYFNKNIKRNFTGLRMMFEEDSE